MSQSVVMAIENLFAAFLQSKPSATRIDRYLHHCQSIPDEAIVASCEALEREADRMPTIGAVRSRAVAILRGQGSVPEDEQRQREEDLRYHLRRYSDADYWTFFEHFHLEPSRGLFERHKVEPPRDVRFCVPDREAAESERRGAMSQAREAYISLVRGLDRPRDGGPS